MLTHRELNSHMEQKFDMCAFSWCLVEKVMESVFVWARNVYSSL